MRAGIPWGVGAGIPWGEGKPGEKLTFCGEGAAIKTRLSSMGRWVFLGVENFSGGQVGSVTRI